MAQLRNKENGTGWIAVSIPGVGVQYEPPADVIAANMARTSEQQTASQPAPTRQRAGSRPGGKKA